MKVIRNNVFETNSSSVHSIVMAREFKAITKEQVRDKLGLYSNSVSARCDIYLGRYSWGPQVLSSFSDKLDYIVTLIACNIKKAKEMKPVELEHKIKSNKFFKQIARAIAKYAEVDNEDYYDIEIPESEFNWYIDHDSVIPVDKFLGELSMSEYLFNPRIMVEIFNDNDDPKDMAYSEYRHMIVKER